MEILNSDEILVDTREKSGSIDELRYAVSINPKASSFVVHSGTLPVGDFKYKNLGAELKSLSDFIGSIHSGRIFRQAFDMSNTYEFSYVLVHGDMQRLAAKDQKGIYTTVADIEARYGHRVMFFPDLAILCYYFAMLCLKHSKDLKPLWRFVKQKPSITDESNAVLEGIYGVGDNTASELLKTFKSVANVVNATIPELTQVSKIGEKKAKHIFEVLHYEK